MLTIEPKLAVRDVDEKSEVAAAILARYVFRAVTVRIVSTTAFTTFCFESAAKFGEAKQVSTTTCFSRLFDVSTHRLPIVSDRSLKVYPALSSFPGLVCPVGPPI